MRNLPIALQAYSNFKKFRDHQLFIIKRKYNLSAEVIEDIFQDALLVAIDKFDQNRGEFKNFFPTVFENRVKNYVRDIKLRIMLSSIDTYENIEDMKEDALSDTDFPDFFNSMDHFSNSLKKRLSESEFAFFEELRNVIVDYPRGFISLTSMNLGMEPTKGWNIWRRVQRKITQLLNDKRAEQELIEVREEDNTISSKDVRFSKSPKYLERQAEIRNNFPLLNFLSQSDIQKLLSYFE